MNDELQRALAKHVALGEPGPALPWHEDGHGGWHQLLAGGERVVATVAEYSPDLGPRVALRRRVDRGVDRGGLRHV